MNSRKIKLSHPRPMASGFFSYCSAYLHQIIENIKKENNLSDIELGEFEFYKTNKEDKIYESFFEKNPGDINIQNIKELSFPLYSNRIFYKKSDFLGSKEIIKKWFGPKKEIKILKNNFIIDLNIKTSETLSVYYRGTDTQSDRGITQYDIFVNKAKDIICKNKIKKIFLQTDDKMFEDYILSSGIKQKIVKIKEMPSVYSHKGYHFTMKGDKVEHTKKMLASALLMSECKYVLCNTSNLSRWILIYRDSGEGYYQFLKGKCL
jgi:hypothetical protein